MKTQILSLNLGMNLLNTIIKASKFVFLEDGLMPPGLIKKFSISFILFQIWQAVWFRCIKQSQKFSQNSKEFYCSWIFLSEALSKTQFGWSQSSKILRLCKILTKGCIILLDVTVLYMYKVKWISRSNIKSQGHIGIQSM